MKKTDFGKYMAQLRIVHNQTQRDIAEILDVSPAFLCRVETGISKPVLGWVDILSKNCSLSPEETEKLRNLALIERAKGMYIRNLEIADQNLVALLVTKISDMPPEKKEKIKKLISE